MMYKHAIVRHPPSAAVSGLTSVDLGKPDLELLKSQCLTYIQTLKSLGVEVTELEPLEEFPDSYFVEDVAVIVPETAVVMRPGAMSRRNETDHIVDVLKEHRPVKYIKGPGTIDGGDVLVVGNHCIVGLSQRTNHEGARQLCEILSEFGYKGDIVNVPEALHFKSSVNFGDAQTLLVTQSAYWLECISDYRKLVVPEGEEYAANVVWINDHILVPEGFPGTNLLLNENGFNTITMSVSEIAKMDGGLTCLSLRLT